MWIRTDQATGEPAEKAQDHDRGGFSAQFEANYTQEKKRAQRERREAQEAREARERERIRGIFAGTGINGKI